MYTVTGTTAGQNGNQYRVVATSACATSTTSNAVTLTVISPVIVGTQPVNREICAGGNTTFSITASSSQTITYQWQVSTNNGGSWTNITDGGIYAGTGTATLSLTNAAVGNNTYQYRCLVNNITCTNPVNSNAAVLTVRALPTVILSAGGGTSLLPGKTTTLTATPGASNGGILATAWFFNNNPISNIGNTRIVNVEQVGTYRVNILKTYPSGLSCSNQSADVVIEATISDKLFIFPSPNDGRFTVSYYNNGGTSTQRRIIIHDTKGARVYDRQFNITGAYTLLPIDLRSANRGIYFVSVGDAGGAKLVEGKVHIR
ncbi:MAG: T9SS type A sorting domain-containing protein [Chitinophagaceae bacterium]|nr:T9SS type A sorting domain-containing protein [Chitinophagaceae bacterium]